MTGGFRQPFQWLVPWTLLLFIVSCNGQGVSLVGGRFETTTDVTSWLNLANDAADIREAQDETEEKDIYDNGRHSVFTSEGGTETKRTLAGLSLNSYPLMAQDSLYNLFRHTFYTIGDDIEGETPGNFDQKPVQEYANTLVNDLFALNVEHIETEAALILNVWMQIVHELEDVVRACRVQNADTMNEALDIAAALWVGADQPEGVSDQGNMLYNLAQIAAERFNQANGEALANTKVLDAMNTIKAKIDDGTCSNGDEGYVEMRSTVHDLIGSMTIPLVQILIHHIRVEPHAGGANFIELYALSFLPRVQACDPTAYDKLLKLLVRNSLKVEDKDEAISLLQSIYDCIGVTCADIGSYQSGEVPECSDDVLKLQELAGYTPTTDFQTHSFLDRDILAIRKMTFMRAYDAAMDYYKYGFNARGSEGDYLTLHDLATSPDRSVVSSQYNLYTSYFGSDDYADKLVSNVLTSVSPFDLSSDVQRSEVVAGYLNEIVMYMAVLQKLHQAAQTCDSDKSQSQQSLDQAVAYYVGSIEGNSEGGLDGGQLLYATSKQLCDDFSKCVGDTNSEVNSNVMSSLSQMSVSVQLGACDDVQTTLQVDVEPLLLVPLIQGSLHYAVENANLSKGAEDGSLGTADPFALSLVPFVNNADTALGTALLTNLEFRPDLKPVSDGPAAVFDVFKTALPQFPVDVDCQLVGQYASFGSVCPGGATSPTSSSNGSTPNTEPTAQPADDSSPTSAPIVSQPDTLGFGRYTFSSDVSIASLPLDVRDMRSRTSTEEARDIYANGANAAMSLASLSLDAADVMSQDRDFNLFRFALASEEEFGDGSYKDASTYADIAAQKAFSTANDVNLAAEVSVILHIWMQIAHYLYESVRTCEEGGQAIDRLDDAVALWLGEDQIEKSDNTGHSMYSIAEKAATRFGLDETQEAPTNTVLFELYNKAKKIALDCGTAPDMFLDLRIVVADILEVSTVPLMQNLMFYLSKASSDAEDYFEMENYVELYSLSLVPHAIGCTPTTFFFLQDKLIDNDFDNSLIDDEVISNLKRLQGCFDITCTDLSADSISDSTFSQFVEKLCREEDDGMSSIVGYQPSTDVTEYLRLDRDIVQLGIMAETEAFKTALDIYQNGYNSRLESRALSLRSLALSSDRSIVQDQFQQFSDYYGTDKFADKTIVDALMHEGQFASASTPQRREVAIRTLQGMVSYMALLTNLYTAVDKCRAVEGSQAISFWDKGVAMFVGSIEGENSGGDPNGYGEFLYSLAKEVCDDFGTCDTANDAPTNEDLMDSFSDGFALLDENNCDSLERMIKMHILPNLQIPLVQGTLDYASQMAGLPAGSTDDELAAGYSLSRAILPLVNDSNSSSAQTIDTNMDFQLSSSPVPDGSTAIVDAFTFSLTGMNIDCKDIGTMDGVSVCSETLRPHPSTPTEIGADGMYTTTTYVKDRSNIALDVLAIRNALENDNPDLARDIYRDGENSAIYNQNGIKVGQRTLQSFSTNAPTDMAGEPNYNIYKYALQDDQGQFLGQDVGLYADSIVMEAFDNTSPSSNAIAAEAIIVYNVWMYLVHELSQTLRQCKSKAIFDSDGVHSIDEAAAYWIGDGQVTGDSGQGHMLYALAEQMGERFGVEEDGQSRTNTNILKLFNEAKFEMSLPTSCSDNPDTLPRVSQIVNRIVSWMTVPLVQGLISSLHDNHNDRVKLYARALLPLIAGCSNSTFTYLSDELLAKDFSVVDVDDIIARLQTTYECLGFTCDDVGVHELDTSTCADTPDLSPLAGYAPESDVRSFALLDLDILRANILMEMGAFTAVEDLYSLGKHALVEDDNGLRTLSLYQLATTPQRSMVPQFESFNRYYDSDKYADDIIRQALDTDNEKFQLASTEQRQETVVKTMQYLVVYMAALQEMYQAIADCDSSDSGNAEEAWDRAAAFLVGSLEGPEDGGNEEGMSFYRLALKRCEQFGTCDPEGRPSWNDEYTSLLYTGRASIQGGACGELRKAVEEVETLLVIPLIQGTLRYALANEKLGESSQDKGLGEGYAFSRSVLPLVDATNQDSAKTISENMDFQFDRLPVHDGAGAVFNAFARAYGGMNVNCEDVGQAEGHDACSNATSPSGGPRDTNAGMIVGIIIGVLAVFAIVALFLYDRKRKRKAQDETPSFILPKGEMNHTPDNMTGDAYTAAEVDYEEGYGDEKEDLVDTSPTDPDADSPDNSFSID